MRAFVAIEVPPNVRAAITLAQTRFRKVAPHARWTSDFHLTLKFLGPVADPHLPTMIETLASSERFEKFTVVARGFGFFPNSHRPRVLWAGVHAPPALAELAARIEDAMAGLGYPREQREFHPHLTLARFKDARLPPALETLVERSREEVLGAFEVSEFFLWESRLSPEGSNYRKVARFGGAEAATSQ
jgi:2'-5' RNA ligase